VVILVLLFPFAVQQRERARRRAALGAGDRALRRTSVSSPDHLMGRSSPLVAELCPRSRCCEQVTATAGPGATAGRGSSSTKVASIVTRWIDMEASAGPNLVRGGRPPHRRTNCISGSTMAGTNAGLRGTDHPRRSLPTLVVFLQSRRTNAGPPPAARGRVALTAPPPPSANAAAPARR